MNGPKKPATRSGVMTVGLFDFMHSTFGQLDVHSRHILGLKMIGAVELCAAVLLAKTCPRGAIFTGVVGPLTFILASEMEGK